MQYSSLTRYTTQCIGMTMPKTHDSVKLLQHAKSLWDLRVGQGCTLVCRGALWFYDFHTVVIIVVRVATQAVQLDAASTTAVMTALQVGSPSLHCLSSICMLNSTRATFSGRERSRAMCDPNTTWNTNCLSLSTTIFHALQYLLQYLHLALQHLYLRLKHKCTLKLSCLTLVHFGP